MPNTNEPFDVRAMHDGVNTNTYNLHQDGNIVQTKPVSDLGVVEPGKISFSYLTGLPNGSYSIHIEAVGSGGSVVNAPLVVDVSSNLPSALGPMEIIVNP